MLAVLLALAGSGCATRPAVYIPYRASELEPYRTPGTAGVKGQAFMRQRGGGIVTCAGNTVSLTPLTSYVRQVRMERDSGNVVNIDPAAKEAYLALAKTTQCDAQGNFSFSNVPAGDWLLETRVTWMVGYNAQGGALSRQFGLTEGNTLEIILTD